MGWEMLTGTHQISKNGGIFNNWSEFKRIFQHLRFPKVDTWLTPETLLAELASRT
jgi:hypothetical protein